MIEEMLDKLVDEKLDYKGYKEIAENIEDEEIKAMFNKIADDEHNHYKMIREYISQMMGE